MKGRTLRIILSIILPLAVLAVGGAAAVYFYINSPAVVGRSELFVPHGTDFDGLIGILEAEGGIGNVEKFRRIASGGGFDKRVRPGHYILNPGTSYLDAARIFNRGLQTPVRVTFNNVRLLPQLAGRVGGQLEVDSSSLAAVILADTTPAHYGFDRHNFMCMFIPETYEMYWTTSEKGFLDRMKREYDGFWNETRSAKLEKTGLTRDQAYILASIVYEETKKNDEMARVAGVYINRLNRNILLQADPTVKYALGDFALKRVLIVHTKIDHPYNTYYYGGLPPGPICMPSVAAIDAVLNYEEHNYIFFCAREDFSGYHNFAVTGAEHERNRQKWIRALNAAGIR